MNCIFELCDGRLHMATNGIVSLDLAQAENILRRMSMLVQAMRPVAANQIQEPIADPIVQEPVTSEWDTYDPATSKLNILVYATRDQLFEFARDYRVFVRALVGAPANVQEHVVNTMGRSGKNIETDCKELIASGTITIAEVKAAEYELIQNVYMQNGVLHRSVEHDHHHHVTDGEEPTMEDILLSIRRILTEDEQ